MTFRVGQKVESVNVSRLRLDSDPANATAEYLKVGGIYVIRWIGECPFEPWRHFGLNIRLVGIVRPVNNFNPDWSDMPFDARRFRPIGERKTDIGFAQEILRKVTRKNRVSA